jgi:hypothetical protein
MCHHWQAHHLLQKEKKRKEIGIGMLTRNT